MPGPWIPAPKGTRPLGLPAGGFTQRPGWGVGHWATLRFHSSPLESPFVLGGSRRVSAGAHSAGVGQPTRIHH